MLTRPLEEILRDQDTLSPDRVAIADGDPEFLNAIAETLESYLTAPSVKIIQDAEEIDEDKPYDLIIIDDPVDHDETLTEVFETFRKTSPNAKFVFMARKSHDENVINSDFCSMNSPGVIGYVYHPTPEQVARKALVAYDQNARNKGKLRTLYQRSLTVKDAEASILRMLGETAEDHDAEKNALRSGDQTTISLIHSLRAIRIFYDKGKTKAAYNQINAARNHDPQSSLPSQIEAEMRFAVSAREHRLYLANAGQALKTPTLNNRGTLEQVEKEVSLRNLQKPVKNSQGQVSVVKLGKAAFFRREADSDSVQREFGVLRYFHRLGPHLPEHVKKLIAVPDAVGMLPKPSGQAVMYRDFPSGSTLLERLRVSRRRLRNLENTRTGQASQEYMKELNQMSNNIMRVVKQTAYLLAFYPMSYSKTVPDPVTNYYEARFDQRVIDNFNALFIKAGVETLDPSLVEAAKIASAPYFQFLAALPTTGYRDAFFGNTVTTRSSWYAIDFGTNPRIPVAMSFATLPSYGDFLASLDGVLTEEEMIKGFVNHYQEASGLQRKIFKTISSDFNAAVKKELERDIDRYASNDAVVLNAMWDEVEKGNPRSVTSILSGTGMGGSEARENHAIELLTFFRNLKPKSRSPIKPIIGPSTHEQLIEDFGQQYKVALYPRASLVGGTFAGFIAYQEDSTVRTRRLLLSELIGTWENAQRGILEGYGVIAPIFNLQKSDMDPLDTLASEISDKLFTIYQEKLV